MKIECPRYGCKKKPELIDESPKFAKYKCECGFEFIIPKEDEN